MLMRWRPSLAVATTVVRRPLWTQRATRALSTAAEGEEETTDPPCTAETTRVITVPKGTSEKETREFALLSSALKAFYQKAGHFIVPLNLRCVSASEDVTYALGKDVHARVYGRVQDSREIDWPEDVLTEELRIGRVLKKLMKNENHRLIYPDVVSELHTMGFPVDEAAKDWRLFVWNHQFIPALTTYHKVEGHAMVPVAFKVPHGDPVWPETTWGLPLGNRVSDIRTNESRLAPQQLADLDRLGFSLSVSQAEWDTRIIPSFKVFANQYGHCRIPKKYIVPSQAPWPTEAWGMNLGSVVTSIRSRTLYVKQVADDADLLETLGFQPDIFKYLWSDRILPALEMFKQVYGHCDVGEKFVVSSEAPWPEEAWGEQLGLTVDLTRSHGIFTDQMAKDADRLDALGFVWDSLDNRWTQVVLASLEMYFNLHGDTHIPSNFVVPAKEPWPREAWSFKLGMYVQNM